MLRVSCVAQFWRNFLLPGLAGRYGRFIILARLYSSFQFSNETISFEVFRIVNCSLPESFPSGFGTREIICNTSDEFDFKILDVRGVAVAGIERVPFDHPDPISGMVSGRTLEINAQSQQITSQKSFGVEISRDGTAPAFVTVTMETNNSTT